MAAPQPISIDATLDALTFLPNRTPHTEGEEDYFAALSEYRDGAIFVAHYAGSSEWERHSNGDEIVVALAGCTTLILLVDDVEVAHRLDAHQMLIVPQGVWHRFETPDEVKVMSVTPLPTDHQIERPSA